MNQGRGFSQIKTKSRYAEIDPSPAGAKKFLKSTIVEMRERTDRSVHRYILPKRDSAISNNLVGTHAGHGIYNMLASNLRQRWICGSALIDAFHQHQRQRKDRQYRLITLISDRWLSFDRRDTIIWLAGIKKIAAEVMRHGRFDGWFGGVEIQILDESIPGFGRVLMAHFHAVAWTTDRAFDDRAAEKRMSSLPRLYCEMGAPTATVNGDEASSACNLVAYVMKAPSLAKVRVPCPPTTEKPWGFYFADAALPPVAAVRLTQVLSAMYLDEMFIAGGDGKSFRTILKQLVWSNSRESSLNISVEQSQRYWAGARKSGPYWRYPQVTVAREFGQLALSSPVRFSIGLFKVDLLPHLVGAGLLMELAEASVSPQLVKA